MLHGKEFQQWLDRVVWRELPDFLTFQHQAVADNPCQSDLLTLRLLAQPREHSIVVTGWLLASLHRLYMAGMIGRKPQGNGFVYVMMPISHAVLKHNASFRGTPPDTRQHPSREGDRNELA